MKTIMVMFDSLNRRFLSPYGCGTVYTPNFDRLAKNAVTFDRCYVGSMPCIPARRDLHTGRLNFLHRSWGPLEPYDKSVITLLRENGVYTHLVSDHMHYWEEGGANYHTKYNSWVCIRGQEGDCWKAEVENRPDTEHLLGRNDYVRAQDIINRKYIKEPEDFPIEQTFAHGLEFLEKNHSADNWFLQIETFDPHEPFFSHERYKKLYPHAYSGPEFDWPDYKKVSETPEQIEHCRKEYAALVSACDDYLGRVLSFMDEKNMWDDTMLIVCTDHGYLLGEHGWWAKSRQPLFNEVANTPFFVWDPRCGRKNVRCSELVQLIDIPVTLLDFFGIKAPEEMQGVNLRDTIAHGAPTRETILFGMHGCHVNVTDGRYVYMRAPAGKNEPVYNYTLMPAHMKKPFSLKELESLTLSEPFSFTQNLKLLKIPAKEWDSIDFNEYPTMLFDLERDPMQLNPIQDTEVEERMINLMTELMKENDCPVEQFKRLGLSGRTL